MDAVTDHADAAAVVAAGYRKTQIDRLAPGPNDKNPAPRYVTRFEKPITGAAGDSGPDLGGKWGESSVSAAAVDTQAVAALNDARQHQYAGSPGRAFGSAESQTARGGTQTADVT